jgi:hypothetical protein
MLPLLARAAAHEQQLGVGLRRTGDGAQLRHVEPALVGLAGHRQAHGLGRAGELAGEVDRRPHRRLHWDGRRRRRGVGRGQAGDAQIHRPGQRHGGRTPVQSRRRHGVEAALQLEHRALPQRLQLHAAGRACGVGQLHLGAHQLQPVGLGE